MNCFINDMTLSAERVRLRCRLWAEAAGPAESSLGAASERGPSWQSVCTNAGDREL